MSIPFSKLNPDIPLPDRLGLIAGRGAYPLLLAESAKRQGVRHLMAVAFRRETNPAINRLADEVHWLKFGQLEIMLETLRNADIKQAVMAGQITPTSLFRLRPDRRSLQILSGLRARNAHTIFGAVCAELQNIGVTLLPAWRFMENAMPTPGRLSTREPTERERSDIELGLRTAKAISGRHWPDWPSGRRHISG